jgi:hypothetical protein
MMQIALPPEVEEKIRGEAVRHGLPAETYLEKLITEHLQPKQAGKPLKELFASWKAQDGTSDPAEIARRNLEVEEFKQAMNRNRPEMEGENARRLYP